MNERSFMIRDVRYNVRARICACVGLFAGVVVRDVARVMDLHPLRVGMEMRGLWRAGFLDRKLTGLGREHMYHLKDMGNRLVLEEEARVRGEVLAMLEGAKVGERNRTYPRLPVLEQMEEQLRKGHV